MSHGAARCQERGARVFAIHGTSLETGGAKFGVQRDMYERGTVCVEEIGGFAGRLKSCLGRPRTTVD
jgi:hypothetical protein